MFRWDRKTRKSGWSSRTARDLRILALLGALTGLVVGLICPIAASAECLGADSDLASFESTGMSSSADCLTCHDGSLGTDVGLWSSGAGLASLNSGMFGGGEHPIGVDYMKSWERRPDRFHTPAQVRTRIQLPGGKVECVSCHDLASGDDAMLSIPNAGSDLCLACHDM